MTPQSTLAKYKVGDPIHVKLLLKDSRAAREFNGVVEASRLHRPSEKPDYIVYDVWLNSLYGPPIEIKNLPEGMVLDGWPEVEA